MSCLLKFIHNFTTNDIERVETDEWEQIELFVVFYQLLKNGDKHLALGVHNFSEMFQNLEMERRSDDFSSLVPLLAG